MTMGPGPARSCKENLRGNSVYKISSKSPVVNPIKHFMLVSNDSRVVSYQRKMFIRLSTGPPDLRFESSARLNPRNPSEKWRQKYLSSKILKRKYFYSEIVLHLEFHRSPSLSLSHSHPHPNTPNLSSNIMCVLWFQMHSYKSVFRCYLCTFLHSQLCKNVFFVAMLFGCYSV